MIIEYTTIEIKVPKGYEKQVADFAMRKVESIISQLILTPTQTIKDDYATKLSEAYTINKVAKVV